MTDIRRKNGSALEFQGPSLGTPLAEIPAESIMRRAPLICILAVALFLLGVIPACAAITGILRGETTWRGEVSLSGPVEVPPGAVLTVAPGTTVRPLRPEAKLLVQGTLRVEGTDGAPVIFSSPAGWEGIEFRESAGSRVAGARFFGARTAVSAASSTFVLQGCVFRECEIALKLVRLSDPTVEDCLFQNNGIAVDQETRSTPVLRRNVFRKQRQTAVLVTHNCGGRIEGNRFEGNPRGIVLLRQYAGEISGNVFSGNGTAVFCEQTRTSPLLRANRFEKNREGVSSVSFSSPRLEGNFFIGNDIAVRNDQLGSPTVRHNLFRENGTAVSSLRRSTPRVEKNILEGNRVALFCDYSSYPGVSGNNFLGNRRGVELGNNQSADFEKRFGSRAVIQKKSAAKRGKGPGGPPVAAPTGEFIDVRGNWWGKDTSRLASAGPDGNVEIFFDRSDRPTVTMEGYGEERFRLDQVRFHPWLHRRVPDAGPQETNKNPRPQRRG